MNLSFKALAGNASIDEAKGIVECLVAAVGNKDSVNDIIVPGAFDASLKRRRPRVVWGHDWNHPIGKVLDITEVSAGDPRLPSKMREAGVGGLFARVQFNLKSEKGREAFSSVAFYGTDQEWSIGYKTIVSSFDNEKQANILKEVELFEVSPVLHGANQLTGTISIKSANTKSNIATGTEAELAKSLAEYMRIPVAVREVDGGRILFDTVDEDEEAKTFETTFEIKDGEFTFRRPRQMVVETVVRAAPETPSEKGCGGNCECGGKKKASCECGETCSCEKSLPEVIDTKVGRVLSSRNVKKLRDAIEMIQQVVDSAGMQAKNVSVKSADVSGLLEHLSPIVSYHGIEVASATESLSLKGVSVEAKVALSRALGSWGGEAVMSEEDDG